MSLTGDDSSDYEIFNDGCSGESVTVGQNCDFSVRFDASSDGFKRAGVSVTSDAPDSPLTVQLSGFRDATAPMVTIDSGPAGPTTNATPTFEFSADEDADFDCRLFEQATTAPAFTACSGPGSSHTPDPALADGDYTFEVQATDELANVGTEARDFTVDTAAPETTIDSGPSGTITTDQADFTFSSNEAGSTFECRVDSEAFADCSGPGASHTATALTDGPHRFEVRATDEAGNTDATPATRDFTVDTAAPETTIDSGPSGTITTDQADFTFSSNEAGSTFECRVDSEAFADCSGPGASHTATALTDGPHRFEVRATDEAGNTDATPATRDFTVDTAAPETTIDSGPSGTITTDQADFTFSSNEAGSTFECRVDSEAFADCSGPGASHTATALTDGPHRFEVRATDEAGNTDATPATRDFTVDTTVYKAKIGNVKVSGSKKVKKDKKATYKVKISNSGNINATGVKINVKGKGVKARRAVGTIPAGKSKTIKVKLKPKKSGKVKVSFKVTSKNAGGKTAKKKIKVKK